LGGAGGFVFLVNTDFASAHIGAAFVLGGTVPGEVVQGAMIRSQALLAGKAVACPVGGDRGFGRGRLGRTGGLFESAREPYQEDHEFLRLRANKIPNRL